MGLVVFVAWLALGHAPGIPPNMPGYQLTDILLMGVIYGTFFGSTLIDVGAHPLLRQELRHVATQLVPDVGDPRFRKWVGS